MRPVSLGRYLQKMFSTCYKSDIEQYIESKNPKNAADVEHWMQQYTYQNQTNWLPNA